MGGGGAGNIKRGGVALTSSTNVSLGTSELLAKQRFELWSHFLKVHERERKWKVAKGLRGANCGSKVHALKSHTSKCSRN